MHFGFSYVGLIYLIMLMVPNIIWTKNKPEGYEKHVQNENKILSALERIGEIFVSLAALIFSDFNVRRWTLWDLWLIVSFALMLLYEVYWVRYFKGEKTMKDFYSSFFKVPVAGATLPVAAFFLLGIYGSNIVMILSTIILGIGHIGIHLAHRREICGKKEKRHIAFRILQIIAIAISVLIVGSISVVIGMRNVRYMSHYANFQNGVDEGIYISLNGQEQYVLMTGTDVKNPLIVYLHGGPSSPDSYVTYSFADYLTDDFTFVCWDQRGCGRTYFRNMDEDPYNQTATFEQAEKDLNCLVDYVCERFGQDQVIIMGHSYGTILGSQYALDYPDKVTAYIGVAQVTSLEQTDIYSYEDALNRARKAGDDTTALEDAFADYSIDESLVKLMELRNIVSDYHPVEVQDSETWDAVASPYFGMDDFRWFLKQLGDMEVYFDLNRQLFDYTFNFDAYERKMDFQMPVYFISGSDDWICPVDSVQDYMNAILAPHKNLNLMDGCGHNTQYAMPEDFAEIVRKILE